jgi:hypothetical protein
MAYVSAEYVKSLQKTHDSKFWKVYDGSGKVVINKCDQDIGLNASQDLLQDTLENCIGDSVIVKLYTKQPERREAGVNAETGLTLKVKLDSNPGYHPKQNYSSGIGQPSWMDMMAMSDKNRQLELEKLRMELESDKQEHPMMTALYKAMENPAPILQGIGAMISMIMNKNNVSQIGQNTTTTTGSGNIDEAINKFQQIDPDYVNVLSKFADWAKNNPDQYQAVKSSI